MEKQIILTITTDVCIAAYISCFLSGMLCSCWPQPACWAAFREKRPWRGSRSRRLTNCSTTPSRQPKSSKTSSTSLWNKNPTGRCSTSSTLVLSFVFCISSCASRSLPRHISAAPPFPVVVLFWWIYSCNIFVGIFEIKEKNSQLLTTSISIWCNRCLLHNQSCVFHTVLHKLHWYLCLLHQCKIVRK